MNFEEQISRLALVNSGKCYPKRFEDIDTTLPYFQLSKDCFGRYSWESYNYEFHDNAPRMPYVARYISSNVLPYVQGDLSGYYNIQLHDNYSYLNDDKCYNDVLCFGGMKDDKRNKWVVQLPDCYFMGNWGDKYQQLNDNMVWSEKKKKIVFAGTTTGSRDPRKNTRINTCLWALDEGRDKYCDFWITNIAQIDARKIFAEVPRFRYIFRPPIPLDEQMKYRYMLGIDGNTCRWNPDVCFMNTLSLCLPSTDTLWYSCLFMDKQHFVEVDTSNGMKNILNAYKYYENNPREALHIIKNATDLGKKLFTPSVCKEYTIELFQNITENGR